MEIDLIVESLRRLYINKNNSLTEKQIEAVKESAERLLNAKKISIKEYHYILGKDGE